MERKSTEEVVQTLSDFVNSFNCEYEDFAKEVMGEHRTLQQNIMRLFIATIQEWAKQENFDLRNEDTVKLCKRIIKEFGDDGSLYLSHV
jgi:hypothetical protein